MSATPTSPARKKTTDFQFVMPETVIKAQMPGGRARRLKLYEEAVLAVYDLYEKLLDAGVPPEDARYLLPNATVSQIVITANFRELRHFFCVRTHPEGALGDSRNRPDDAQDYAKQAPIVFGDFKIDEETQSATFEFES